MPEIRSSSVSASSLRLLELLLERPRVRLTVSETLLPPRELVEPRVDLGLLLEHPLLDLHDLDAAVLHLGSRSRSGGNRLLPRLDLSLAADALGLASGVLEQSMACRLGRAHPRAGACQQEGRGSAGPDDDSDECRDDREHGTSVEESLVRGDLRGGSHPAPSLRGCVRHAHALQLRKCRTLPRRAPAGALLESVVVESWFGVIGRKVSASRKKCRVKANSS